MSDLSINRWSELTKDLPIEMLPNDERINEWKWTDELPIVHWFATKTKIDYRIFSIKRPPSNKRPPLFHLTWHSSEKICIEILSKTMNTMSHFHWLLNRYMQWISLFQSKFSILIALHEKGGLNDSSSTIQRGANWRVEKQRQISIPKAPGALFRKNTVIKFKEKIIN